MYAFQRAGRSAQRRRRRRRRRAGKFAHFDNSKGLEHRLRISMHMYPRFQSLASWRAFFVAVVHASVESAVSEASTSNNAKCRGTHCTAKLHYHANPSFFFCCQNVSIHQGFPLARWILAFGIAADAPALDSRLDHIYLISQIEVVFHALPCAKCLT